MGSSEDKHHEDGLEILEHEPVPGYRTVFHIAVAVAGLYLLGVFLF